MAAHPADALRAAPAGAGREFQRGWRIVVLALVGAATGVSVTLLYGFGAFVLPLAKAFGWPRGDLQIAISCLSGGVVVASQMAGWLNLRLGMRRVTLASLAALPFAFFALTLVRGSIGWLYLGFFLVPIVGFGVTFVTWTQLVTQWFDRRRGLALALVLCGSGLSAAVLPRSLTWAIERWDWRAGFWLLGLLTAVLTLPLAWRLLVPSPADTADTARGATAAPPPADPASFRATLRSRRYWTLNVALTLVVSAVVGMVTNAVPLLHDIGLSPADAASVFGAFGGALVGGRLLAGWLIDRLWAPGVAAATLLTPAVGCAMLWSANAAWSHALLALAVALVGVGAGAEFDLSAYLVARYFDLKDYGRLFGLHLGLITAGSMLAPFLFAAMYRASGGYGPLLAYCAACCVAGPVLLLTMGRQPPLASASAVPGLDVPHTA